MLKKFFIAFMGTMAAIWLSLMIFIVGLFITISVAIGLNGNGLEVQDNSILRLDLHGVIPERTSAPSVQDFVMGNNDIENVPTLSDMLKAIRLAAKDSKIKGIYIDCGGSELGYASRQELIQAIEEFKKTGKWVYAYGDSYTQGDYFVASSASRIFANPVGMVDIHGLGSTIPFFKNALDKLGVEMQVFKVGTFKSAVEPFLLTEMSEPSRMQTKVFINAIWNDMSQYIAKSRKVSVDKVNQWADSLSLAIAPVKYVDENIVDELCYRRQVEDKMRKLTNVDKDEDLHFVTPAQYLASSEIMEEVFDKEDTDHIALLYAVGDIVDSGKGGIAGDVMVPQILELAEDDHVKGLVLRVNSGGGSAFASEQIWEALEYFKKKGKPFYVSMGDYAASGGYYISSGADVIYAEPATLTGSIGIFGMIPCAQKLLNNHLGINVSTVGSNANANFPQISAPLTGFQYEAMQKHVEDGYELFTSRVAAGRNLPVDSVLKIAEGRVWDGATALKIGLVDKPGSLNDVLVAMSKKTGLGLEKVVAYPEVNLSLIEEMLLSSSSKISNGKPLVKPDVLLDIDEMTPDEVRRYLEIISRVKSYSRIQAKMEDVVLY